MEINDYEEFIDKAPSDDALSKLAALVAELHLAESDVLRCEGTLKDAQARARDLAEKQIPEHMGEVGLAEFKTTDGVKIELKSSLHVTPKKENRMTVLDWLEEQGYGNLIKRTVSVAFNRDQESEAASLLTFLADDRGLQAKEERKVAPATLRKFVADRLEAGKELPMELLGVFQYKYAKITEGKPEKIFDGE